MECISTWLIYLPLSLITRVAIRHDLDISLVAAIVATESGGNSNATRYEPHYRWIVNPSFFAKTNGITVGTEEMHQRTSWGLAQIMGANVRDMGFNDNLLKLADPELALDYGVKHFKKELKKYGNIEDAVSAYNCGNPKRGSNGLYVNQLYVDTVMNKYNQLLGIFRANR